MTPAEALDAIPSLAELGPTERAKLASIATIVDVPTGASLFREGDPSEALYLLHTGRIALSMRVPGRPEVAVLTLGPGELIGWSALLAAGSYVATGRATERSVLVRVPRDGLRALCEADHDVGYAVMRLALAEVAGRLHDTRLQLLDLFGSRR